ncbi:hypothetical protein Tco_0926531 [Tanacetum coccineum]|uniref:Uncharacterized protein n=1 Tax=Tanacetum coccineum TaxID=301880 RepID=A0ABQ5DB74_9ASTR
MKQKDADKEEEKMDEILFMRKFRGRKSTEKASDTADFWDTQQDWKLISWKLHSSSGVHTIMTSTGLVFHMLWKAKYPAKESTSQMLDLEALETERKLYGFGADSSL